MTTEKYCCGSEHTYKIHAEFGERVQARASHRGAVIFHEFRIHNSSALCGRNGTKTSTNKICRKCVFWRCRFDNMQTHMRIEAECQPHDRSIDLRACDSFVTRLCSRHCQVIQTSRQTKIGGHIFTAVYVLTFAKKIKTNVNKHLAAARLLNRNE